MLLNKAKIGVITGSGCYDFPLEGIKKQTIATRYGEAECEIGQLHGHEVVFIARHGAHHARLPNMINHRANLLALQKLEVGCIVATTVCGVLASDIPLAQIVLFDDLFFPDNRLPSGEACTIYDVPGEPKRGHYMGPFFSRHIRNQIAKVVPDAITNGIYGHVHGPRLDARAEIKFFKDYASCISQTGGPEVVLAAELEIPYQLLGFGVNYPPGISEETTSPQSLAENLGASKGAFVSAISKFIANYQQPPFEGMVYRFA